MKTRIQILVGSVMGSALRTAQFLQKNWGEAFDIEVNESPDAQDLQRNQDEILLFCVSNTGAGEFPKPFVPLYQHLIEEQPNLAGRHVMLINLGDSAFPLFGNSGKLLEDALNQCGVRFLSERYLIDAKQHRYPQKAANIWFEEQVNAVLHIGRDIHD